MPRFERICPECGASNSFDRTNCVQCHAPLAGAGNPRSAPPAPLSRRGMANLAWRATKFLARTGFQMALSGTRRGIEHLQTRNRQDVKSETIDAEYDVPRAEGPASNVTRGGSRDWRVWSAEPAPEPEDKARRVGWGSKKGK